jgi:glycosyltransferase involved in cell wall biosynthesis
VPPLLRVSVVVVAYNEAGRIGACLASLAAQRFAHPVEYLLVDGESDDATIAEARARDSQSAAGHQRWT